MNYSAFKPTQDNWNPSFRGEQVKVSYFEPDAEFPGTWRVEASGATGCKVVRRYYDAQSASGEFWRLLAKDFVNFNDLMPDGVDVVGGESV
jgi:hypothetical protein